MLRRFRHWIVAPNQSEFHKWCKVGYRWVTHPLVSFMWLRIKIRSGFALRRLRKGTGLTWDDLPWCGEMRGEEAREVVRKLKTDMKKKLKKGMQAAWETDDDLL